MKKLKDLFQKLNILPAQKLFLGFLIGLNLILILFLLFPKTSPKSIEQFAPINSKSPSQFNYYIPEKITFADEEVPIREKHIYEKVDAALSANIFRHTKTLLSYKRANRWFPQIEAILKKNKLPDDFKYLSLVESNLLNLVSVKGAAGFWQLLPETARQYGLEVNEEVDERYHPIKATEAAAKYFRDAYRIFKNWTLVAASYNMGMKALKDKIAAQKVNSYYDLYLNPETTAYIFEAIATKCIFESPEKYGYAIPANLFYQIIPFKEIKVTQSIPDLVQFAKEQGVNYNILKEYNPWLKNTSLTVKDEGEEYIILIPLNKN